MEVVIRLEIPALDRLLDYLEDSQDVCGRCGSTSVEQMMIQTTHEHWTKQTCLVCGFEERC